MANFNPTPEERILFEETSASFDEWLTKALERAKPEMILGIISSATCEGAVRSRIPKDIFLREMERSYDGYESDGEPERASN